MKKIYTVIIIICSVFFFDSCSTEINDSISGEKIIVNSRSMTPPPPGSTCVDSLMSAMHHAWLVSGLGLDSTLNPLNFTYIWNDTQDVVVQMVFWKHGAHIFVNRQLIRQYTWQGYLLIALHEWFHFYKGVGLSNDEGHVRMITDPLYHLWIRETFNCSDWVIQRLVYVGMENTPIYEALPEEIKREIEWCIEEYNIKK